MDKIHFKLNAMQSKHTEPQEKYKDVTVNAVRIAKTFLHSCIKFIKWLLLLFVIVIMIILNYCDVNSVFTVILLAHVAMFDMIKITAFISLYYFIHGILQKKHLSWFDKDLVGRSSS